MHTDQQDRATPVSNWHATTGDRVLDLLRERLVAALTPQRIILFGSRATLTARADSDYDLLVVTETDLPLGERGLRARRAVRDIHVPKDIVVVTPTEFARHATWVSGVVREVIKHGQTLYEAG